MNVSPTIPFLVGAYRRVRLEDKFSIHDLFDEFSETAVPENIEISLRLCHSVNHYVISKMWKYGSLQSSPIKLAGNRTVSYESSAEILGNEINALKECFDKLYGQVLEAGHYSFDDRTGKWREFSPEEIFQITRIGRQLDK